MYKVIRFEDGAEGLANELGNVEVKMYKDATVVTAVVFTEERPTLKNGKYIIEGKKSVVDLNANKPHNNIKEPPSLPS